MPAPAPAPCLPCRPAQDAFGRAHEAALAVYDEPPASLTYPSFGLPRVTHTLYVGDDGLPCYRADGLPRGGALDRPLECGATCTLAVVQGDRLLLAHVGDSAAALVSLTNDGDVTPRLTTVDHNGRDAGEAARVAKGFGHVSAIDAGRGYLCVGRGRMAGHQLSVTRALGHKHLAACGVLTEPTVETLQLQPDDVCLVRARARRLPALRAGARALGCAPLHSWRAADQPLPPRPINPSSLNHRSSPLTACGT